MLAIVQRAARAGAAYSEQVPSTTRVLIVRHAESTFNAEKRYQGRADAAVLTAKGLATVALLGRRLAGERIEAIVSSPLQRARQTAEALAAELPERGKGPTLREDANLMEVDLPEWEGLAIETVRRASPEAYRQWQQEPEAFSMMRNGAAFYPVRELYTRAAAFWRDCLARHAGRTVLVVTHSGTARALLSTAVGIGEAHFNNLEQSNGAISAVEFRGGAGYAAVETMNATAHLGRVLPKLKAGKSGVRVVLLAGEREAPPGLPVDLVLREAPERADLLRRAAEMGRAGVWNVLWRGPAESAQAIVAPLLGLAPGRAWWKDPRDAVLHFPGVDRAPLVQALNALDAAKEPV